MDVKTIVSRMSPEEKAAFVAGQDFWHTRAIERLGVPAVMLTDGPCGLRKQADQADHLGINVSIKAVSYPTGSCVACSFDRDLVRRSGEALGDEARAEGIGVLLGPAVNIKRSPLCGRNFEYFSEDPYLAGELAVAYIRGVQSRNVGTSIKHFAANSQEYRRMTSSSDADERTLREIYLPAFEAAVKRAKPWTVMCSYNRINGVFASENDWLLNRVLRDEWGFDGFVVSDWGAVNERVKGVAAGLDLEMPGPGTYSARKLLDALACGELDEAALDLACEHILNIVDRCEKQAEGVFDYEGHHAFAAKMAAESMVLLKNEESLLPLDKSAKVAFLGAFAQTPRFQGGGSSHVNSYKVTSALEAAAGLDILYAPGFTPEAEEPDEALIAQAVETAKAAQAAVLFVGTTELTESEGYDRADLSIPAAQQRLIEAVAEVQPNTVVVVHAGGCVEMPWVDKVKAVLYAYLGGEAVGSAVKDILFGDVNPSGRLAETFPLRLEDTPAYLWFPGEGDHTAYREGVFVGYRWYDKLDRPVLFPFGHGLSYTSFAYSDLKLDRREMADTDTLHVSVKVKNTGSRAGKEVVQLYVVNAKGRAIRPLRELRGFEKTALAPGEEREVNFTLDKRAFAFYSEEKHDWFVESGEYGVAVGSSSRDLPLCEKVSVHSTQETRPVFHLNSTIGDVMKDARGAQIMTQMMSAAASAMGAADADSEGSTISPEMIAAMMENMPLRGILMFAGDDITPEAVEQLLAAING